MKILRVNKSREPNISQMTNMAKNLELLPGITYARISANVTNFITSVKPEYQIALQPGLDGDDCSIHYFKTWPECQDFYFNLMKGATS